MRNIKILHIYSKALDLYGDYKNLTVLSQRIRETGNQVEIITAELFENLEFSGFDMVYIGHGKVKNLAAVAAHFVPYADKVKEQIENGQVWFVTGNASELFGQSFTTPDGGEIKGIGLFDYKGVETNKVFVSDMIGRPVFDKEETVYGFANRTAYLEGENKYPLFEVIDGFSNGKTPDGKEGTLYKNFFATWSMGPVLSRNPALMREILKRLLKEDYKECDYTLEQQALELVLAEFKKG
ncbi:MAG: hypothetical protein IKY33_03090 [Clostridia bacterium]|nr:hypothetical protein [Clostridia bacterium]